MFDRLDRTPPGLVFALAGVLVAGITYLDFRLGYEEASVLFYFLPIFLASWRGGPWSGYPIALSSGAGWWLADHMAGHLYSQGWIEGWNVGSRAVTFVLIAALFVALGETLRRERGLARTDPLTGVANARHFGEVLSQEIARCGRTGAAFTLAYLDLDDFKAVNDTLGHSAGDHLLALVAGALRAGVRNIDTVARLGGDEFAVLFPECGEGEAEAALGRLQDSVADAVAGAPRPTTFSLGAVVFLRVPADADGAVQAADALMYEVKRSGKAGARLRTWQG